MKACARRVALSVWSRSVCLALSRFPLVAALLRGYEASRAVDCGAATPK